MSKTDKISQVLNLWNNGHNCAQATAKGLLAYSGYENEGNILSSSFLPYGGGFKEGSVCGAVSGTLAAMSFLLTQSNQDGETIINLTNQMKSQFVERYTSINCEKLLNSEIVKNFSDEHCFCTELVEFAAKSAQKIIDGI